MAGKIRIADSVWCSNCCEEKSKLVLSCMLLNEEKTYILFYCSEPDCRKLLVKAEVEILSFERVG